MKNFGLPHTPECILSRLPSNSPSPALLRNRVQTFMIVVYGLPV